MRLGTARIAPLRDEELDEAQRAALAPFGDRVLNIFRTLARAPAALTRFNAWGGYVLSRRNSLSPRAREILILRTGFLCRSGYEFAQHTRIGLESGLSLEEIGRIKAGAEAGWPPEEAVLIRAADELVRDQFVSADAWAELSAHYDEKARMDVVFTVAQYTQVSMMLNSFGVQLEDPAALDPDLDARSADARA